MSNESSTSLASDELTANVLNAAQERFPLVERPYAEIGVRLGIDEAEAFRRLSAAREAGIVRQVGAIFDTRALGHASSLVAMEVASGQLERAVAVVNAHPGVSHNYLRDHEFNLWFTIAVPPEQELDVVVARLAELSGARACRPLPTLRLFKIGVALDATGRRRHDETGEASYSEHEQRRALGTALDAADIDFVREAQRDHADTPRPFTRIAEQLGVPVPRILEQARRLRDSGHMRRFAAILNHRRAGFSANGMAVWSVPVARVEEVGRTMAGFRAVTHCYQRPTYPDWPDNVFTMIHGRERSEVEAVVDAIRDSTGVAGHRVLYSTHEFKKVRLSYFTPEHERWAELCEAAAAAPATVPAT